MSEKDVWCYNVLATDYVELGEKLTAFEICEAYYTDGKLMGHTGKIAPCGDSLDELELTLERMLKAVKKAKEDNFVIKGE